MPVVGWMLIRKISFKQMGLVKTSAGTIVIAVLMSVVGFFSVNFMQNAWIWFITKLGGTVLIPDLPELNTVWLMLCGVFAIAVTAGLFEELVFRGGLIRSLTGRVSEKKMLVIVSVMFMLMHGSVLALPHTFILGLVMGWMALRSGSIWPSIIYHFTNNALAVFLSFVAEKYLDTLGADNALVADQDFSLIPPSTIAIYLLVFVIGMGILVALGFAFKATIKNPPPVIVVKEGEKPKAVELIPIILAAIGMLMLVSLDLLIIIFGDYIGAFL